MNSKEFIDLFDADVAIMALARKMRSVVTVGELDELMDPADGVFGLISSYN
jgi:hypothetical protein